MVGKITSYDGSNGVILDIDKGGDAQWAFSSSDVVGDPVIQGDITMFDNQPQEAGLPARATNVTKK